MYLNQIINMKQCIVVLGCLISLTTAVYLGFATEVGPGYSQQPCYNGGPTGAPHDVWCIECGNPITGVGCEPDDENSITCDCYTTDYGMQQDYDGAASETQWLCGTNWNCYYCQQQNYDKQGCIWAHYAYQCDGGWLGLTYFNGGEMETATSTNYSGVYKDVNYSCPSN